MANVVCASSEFDVFADRPVQTSTVRTVEIVHNPNTGVDQRDIEFTLPGDEELCMDRDMQLYIKGQLLGADGAELHIKDYTAAVNNVTFSIRAMQHESKQYFDNPLGR
jgi:intein-encoded DNA endonuclease-like protein